MIVVFLGPLTFLKTTRVIRVVAMAPIDNRCGDFFALVRTCGTRNNHFRGFLQRSYPRRGRNRNPSRRRTSWSANAKLLIVTLAISDLRAMDLVRIATPVARSRAPSISSARAT